MTIPKWEELTEQEQSDLKLLLKSAMKTTNIRFSPPTRDEVLSYTNEMGRTKYEYRKFDADKFVDFYSAKNWMVGRIKMKDWKAAVRNAKGWCLGEYNPDQDNDQASALIKHFKSTSEYVLSDDPRSTLEQLIRHAKRPDSIKQIALGKI